MSPTSITSLAAVALLLGGVTGCSSSPEAGQGAPSAASATPTSTTSPSPTSPTSPAGTQLADPGKPVVITIKDFVFEGPASVPPGAVVTVVNEDRSSHTVTSPSGDFEEVIVEGGAQETFTAPTQPGEYAYVCDFHPEMTGTLVVT